MAARCSIEGCDRPHTARGFCHRHYREFLREGGDRIAQPTRHYGLTPEERFRLYVRETPQCWEWTGYKNEKGYGVINLRGERVMAHRMAYELAGGTIPKGLFVLHHCDNPGCVRPKHLFVGTLADNNADMDRKGRGRRGHNMPGTGNHRAKLTEDDIRAIRASPENGQVLADRYGVAREHIWAIRQRIFWSHIE
jgi:hypothetical protein